MKKVINEAEIEFPAKSVNENFARYAVSAFCAQLDPTIEELADIRTAVSESVTNAIVHGYRDSGNGKVYINCKICEDRTVIIKVRDKGCGIADIKQAMEPLFTTCSDEERSGLGFTMMQSFCDKVRVRSKLGKGTTVTLMRRISMRERHADQ